MRLLMLVFFLLVISNDVFCQYVPAMYSRTVDSIHVFIPDSILCPYGHGYIKNTPSENLYNNFLIDKIANSLQDSIITVYQEYRGGKLNGEVKYLLDNKYLVMSGRLDEGMQDGMFFIFGGDNYSLRAVRNFRNGKLEGVSIELPNSWNGTASICGSVEVNLFFNGELKLELMQNCYNYTNLIYNDNSNHLRTRRGRCMMTRSPTEYTIIRNDKNGKTTKYIEIDAKTNRIIDVTKKKGYRVYYGGYIYDLFHSKNELRSERWLKRKLRIK